MNEIFLTITPGETVAHLLLILAAAADGAAYAVAVASSGTSSESDLQERNGKILHKGSGSFGKLLRLIHS